MRTLGVDLASSPARTAACVIGWEDPVARVEHVQAGVDDDELRRLAADVDKVGIDVPFGWPDGFVESVSAHHEMEPWPGFDSADLRLRRTDEFVWKSTKRQPLSVSADKLAVPAFRAARLLSEWQADRTGAGRFVEVYPRAARARFELARTRSIKELQERAPWLTLALEQEKVAIKTRTASTRSSRRSSHEPVLFGSASRFRTIFSSRRGERRLDRASAQRQPRATRLRGIPLI